MPPSPFASTAATFAKAATAKATAAAGRSGILHADATAATAAAAAKAQSVANARLRSFRRIVQSRVSARRFEPNAEVPDRVWEDVLRMTMSSPSGFNLQPTHVILLRDPRLKSALSKHAMLGFGNQYRTTDASAVAVFCADLEPAKRVERIHRMEREGGAREDGYLAVLRVAAPFLTGERSNTTTASSGSSSSGGSARLSTLLKGTFARALSPVQPMPTMEDVESWSYKNAGIAAQTYTMAATAHGLSTCMMEGFDARRAREILRVPERFGIPLMVATGYDHDAEPVVHADLEEMDGDAGSEEDEGDVPPHGRKRTPRLDMSESCFGDTFGNPLDILFDSTFKRKDVA